MPGYRQGRPRAETCAYEVRYKGVGLTSNGYCNEWFECAKCGVMVDL